MPVRGQPSRPAGARGSREGGGPSRSAGARGSREGGGAPFSQRTLPPERFQGVGAKSDLVRRQPDAGGKVETTAGEVGGHGPGAGQAGEPAGGGTEGPPLAHGGEGGE